MRGMFACCFATPAVEADVVIPKAPSTADVSTEAGFSEPSRADTAHTLLASAPTSQRDADGVKESGRKKLKYGAALCVSSGSVVDFGGGTEWAPGAVAAVNAANRGGLGGAGVDGAMSSAGGELLCQHRSELPVLETREMEEIRIRTGSAVATGPARYGSLHVGTVIHAVGPNYLEMLEEGKTLEACDKALASAYRSSMAVAKERGMEYVGFALLSAGIFRGPRSLKEVLQIAVDEVSKSSYQGLREVHLVAFKDEEVSTLLECMQPSKAQKGQDQGQKANRAAKKQERAQQLTLQRRALYAAAKGGDLPGVRQAIDTAAAWLRAGLQESGHSDQEGETRRQLQKEVVNHRFDDKFTALMTSAEAGHVEVVRLLMAEGSDAAARNSYGQSAVHLATIYRQAGAVGALVEPPETRLAVVSSEHQGATPLEWAAKLGHEEIVEILLNAGSDVNHVDDNGRSALCLAVMADPRSLPIIQKLAAWPGCNLRRPFPVSSGLHTLAEFARHQGLAELIPILTPSSTDAPTPAAAVPAPMPAEEAGSPKQQAAPEEQPERVARASASSPLEDGFLAMGRYKIQGEPLGEGGWCVVYAAVDTRTNERVAVKTYRDQSVREAGQEAISQRFAKEVAAFEALGLGPGSPLKGQKAWHLEPRQLFVNLLDFSRGSPGGPPAQDADGRFYTVLELADGGSLEGWLPMRSERPDEALVQLREVGRALAASLAWLVQHKLVHCDLKPANIMRFGDRWKLIDIEGAVPLDVAAVAVKPDDFTPLYACPELGRAWLDALAASGETGRNASCSPTAKMDVWSAGVVLLDVLARQCAFEETLSGFQSAAFMEMDGTENEDSPMGLKEWYEWLVDSAPVLPKDYASPPALAAAAEGSTPELHRLLRALLEKDPAKRLSTEQFRSHPALGLDAPVEPAEIPKLSEAPREKSEDDEDDRPTKCRCFGLKRRAPAKKATS